MKQKFDPNHIECALCHDIIWSKYPGQFVTCKCGAISVDQTEYYSRWIGDKQNFIWIPKEGEEDV